MLTIERGKRRGRLVRGAALVVVASALVSVSVPVASAAGGDGPRGGPRVILDTDLSLWWDDASTIGLANVLHERGELRLLGIVSNVPNTVAVAALDAINTAYGNGDIPLGAVAGSEADTFEHGYTDEVVRRLPNSVRDHDDVPPAVAVYRRLLAKQPDHSVTIVSVGGYTNLASLLESKAVRAAPSTGARWSRRR